MQEHRETWTDAEIAVVRRLYPAGGSEAVHTVLPHRTRPAIMGAARRHRVSRLPGAPRKLGIPVVKWDAANIARLVELRSRQPRLSDAEIAAEFGCTMHAIATAVSRHGLARSRESGRSPALRPCICCRAQFNSSDIGNRMCPRCIADAREAA